MGGVSNPAPASGVFNQIVPVSFQKGGGTNTWVDTDMSASLPAGTLFALVVASYNISATVPTTMGARTHGSASAMTVAGNRGPGYAFIVAPDTNRHIDLYDAQAGSAVEYELMGYWK